MRKDLSFILAAIGLNESWRGKTAWGHPDYVRRGVRHSPSTFKSFNYVNSTDINQAHRHAVLEIMTTFISAEKVRFSKTLMEIQQRSDKVILKFADGDVAEASILVGADGIKSTVREHVLRPLYPSQVEPVYANSYCYRGVTPTSEAKEIFGDLTDVAKMYVGERLCCVTYLISKGDVSLSSH
jgi:2-polyprenyl-6-methoxyphenol hydroxylase-like FAD-dependent oxidoreductase